jgi:hypothetical protein
MGPVHSIALGFLLDLRCPSDHHDIEDVGEDSYNTWVELTSDGSKPLFGLDPFIECIIY